VLQAIYWSRDYILAWIEGRPKDPLHCNCRVGLPIAFLSLFQLQMPHSIQPVNRVQEICRCVCKCQPVSMAINEEMERLASLVHAPVARKHLHHLGHFRGVCGWFGFLANLSPLSRRNASPYTSVDTCSTVSTIVNERSTRRSSQEDVTGSGTGVTEWNGYRPRRSAGGTRYGIYSS
jgi:hypothetical protein